ncbi:DUF3313 domain-containing protein [Luminiphilus sp.]|nr:DUF3313 domain-containing protein [Luminiphilus sp.]MDB2433277.1 DUF3313 domain-containing protein [Luminiphilus sp.]
MRILFPTLMLALGACTATPTIDPGAPVSPQGLVKVSSTIMDEVYVYPELDLSGYDKLMVEGLGIEFRHVKDRGRFIHGRGDSEFYINAEQREKFRQGVREVMSAELKDMKHFTLTDQAGEGVLLMRIGLADVVSRVPPESIGRVEIYLSDLGSATLVIELRDARSYELLARIADRRDVEPGMAIASNPVTNSFEVKREMQQWGSIVTNGLDELHERGCLACGE